MDAKIIYGFILGIVAAFFGSLFTYFFSERRRRKEQVETFRSKVLNALESIYPITHPWWDERLFPKFSPICTHYRNRCR